MVEININSNRLRRTLAVPSISLQDKYYIEIIQALREGEWWKRKKSKPLPIESRFRGYELPCQPPFQKIVFYGEKVRDYCTLGFELKLDGFLDPKKLGEVMKEDYKDYWNPDLGLSGILLQNIIYEDMGEVKAPFIAVNNNSFDLNISVGTKGTIPLKYSTKERFQKVVETFVGFTSHYINAGIKMNGGTPENVVYLF